MLIDPGSPAGKLIASLREEVSGVRACFRDIAVKAIGLAVTATGAILYVSKPDNPTPALGAVGVFFVLVAAQRLGIHKFSTANRLLGYQLHLERLADSDSRLGNIGWEEACRAWRIVQPTIFAALYSTPGNWFTRIPAVTDLWPWTLFKPQERYAEAITGVKRDLRSLLARAAEHVDLRLVSERARKCRGLWWMQAERAELGGGKYHAGSYLERMFALLLAAQVLSLIPLLIQGLRVWWNDASAAWDYGAWAVFCVLCVVLLMNWLSLRRRRRILEREFLSIHSCAIVWKAVAMAHDLAWNRASIDERREYTERLANIGHVLAIDVFTVRLYIDDPCFPDEWATRWPDPGAPVPRPRTNRRGQPRALLGSDTERAVIVEFSGRDYGGCLLDVSERGCRVRFECVAPPGITNDSRVAVRAGAPGTSVSDHLGAFCRTGLVRLPAGEAPERGIGVMFT